jgi:3-oxoadipate enol-lactonase
MLAQEVAVTIPDRIERLALLCTSPGGAGGSSFPLQILPDLNPAERARLYPGLLDTRFTSDWLDTHHADRELIDDLLDRLDIDRPEKVRTGVALQFLARSSHDVFERLPRIHCPTLVTAGRFDGIAPLENSEAIAREIPGAEVQLFEGGHLFLRQDPTALPAILRFLEDEGEPS